MSYVRLPHTLSQVICIYKRASEDRKNHRSGSSKLSSNYHLSSSIQKSQPLNPLRCRSHAPSSVLEWQCALQHSMMLPHPAASQSEVCSGPELSGIIEATTPESQLVIVGDILQKIAPDLDSLTIRQNHIKSSLVPRRPNLFNV